MFLVLSIGTAIAAVILIEQFTDASGRLRRLLDELPQHLELLSLLLVHLVKYDEAANEQQAEDETRSHAFECVAEREVCVEAATHDY